MSLQIDVANVTVKTDATESVVARAIEHDAGKASVGILERDRLYGFDIAARRNYLRPGIDELTEMTDVIICQSINYLVALGNAIDRCVSGASSALAVVEGTVFLVKSYVPDELDRNLSDGEIRLLDLQIDCRYGAEHHYRLC